MIVCNGLNCKLKKILKIIILTIVVAAIVDSVEDRKYYVFVKIIKTACNASGISAANFTCRLKAVSKNNSVVHLRANILKPLRYILADVSIWHKHPQGLKYFRIARITNQEVCKMIKFASSLTGHAKTGIDVMNVSYQGLFHECPYQGNFNVNFSMNYNNEDQREAQNRHQLWPNGFYRHTYRIYNKKDDNIGTFSYWHEYYDRENHLKGLESF